MAQMRAGPLAFLRAVKTETLSVANLEKTTAGPTVDWKAMKRVARMVALLVEWTVDVKAALSVSC